MPPKSPLDSITDADFRAAHAKYGGSLAAIAGHFKASWGTAKKRAERLGLNGDAPASVPLAPTASTPAPEDIVAILQQRLDQCDHCARIRRALEALRA